MKITRINLKEIGKPRTIYETKNSVEIKIENGDTFSIMEKYGFLQIMKQGKTNSCMHIEPSASNVILVK